MDAKARSALAWKGKLNERARALSPGKRASDVSQTVGRPECSSGLSPLDPNAVTLGGLGDLG
eukprot:5198343-Alexandrium_andersonii.AAC.1